MQTGHDVVSFTEIAPHENAWTVRHSLRLGLMRSTCRVLLIFLAICIRLISLPVPLIVRFDEFFSFFLFFCFLVLMYSRGRMNSCGLSMIFFFPFLSFRSLDNNSLCSVALRTSRLFFLLLEVKVDDNMLEKLMSRL